jgi:aldose 1-epimerase
MSIHIENSGDKKDSIELQKIIVENNFGNRAVFTNYGAIICEYHIVKSNGERQDIVLGFDDLSQYYGDDYKKSNPHFGAIIGQVANRISHGKYELNHTSYQLEKNLGSHHLHGGSDGWSLQMWNLVAQLDDAEKPSVSFELKTANDANGYTGSVTAKVTYTLEPNNLVTEIFVTTDADTIVNPTQHTYFNLNENLAPITNHLVQINSVNYLEQDQDSCPTGKLLSVANTHYDFRQYASVQKQCEEANGYDTSFEVEKWNNELQVVAKVKTSDTDYELQVWSNAPCVHFYTGPYIPNLVGKNDVKYDKSSGLCFETQHHPDAINIPRFPSILLKKGETYFQKICYNIALEK